MMGRLPGALLSAALLLAACGGENPPAPEASTIEDLERTGQLPALDRSEDLLGPDLDGNGVRDDIDAWIAREEENPARRAALAQLARAFRAALLTGGDPAAAQDAARRQTRAVACVMARSRSPAEGSHAVSDMRKMSANTKQRVQAYLAYSAALDGAVMSLPAGDGCDD